jgi:hypothetical protein
MKGTMLKIEAVVAGSARQDRLGWGRESARMGGTLFMGTIPGNAKPLW